MNSNGAKPLATPQMAESYNHYFSSGLYRSRYPNPNPQTLRTVQALLPMGGQLLDFGAGEGRYGLALATSREANVTAIDISAAARTGLSKRISEAGLSAKISVGDLTEMTNLAAHQFDVVLMAFGVLAHIAGREQRVDTLKQLLPLLKPNGRLVIGLPNVKRRFHQEQKQFARASAQHELERGDVCYQRRSGEDTIDLFYHLYERDGAQQELADAGYEVEEFKAESILPETLMANSRVWASVDRVLLRCVPVNWAYGFLIVARPNAHSAAVLRD